MVLCSADHGLQADIIFVIEATAVNGAYINDLKTNYIIPTLEYFSQGNLDDVNYMSENANTLYGIVTYQASDCLPNLCSDTIGPFTSPGKLLSSLEKLELIGGKGEAHANVAEGLATSLQCFDELQQRRDPATTAQKHCVLVCNSPPYAMPVMETLAYAGKTAEQLAGILQERNINLSILSPRKIVPLYKLFEKAGGDLSTSQTKNYAKDPRHLVLLKGYSLKERPVSPSPGAVSSTTNQLPNQSMPLTSLPSPLANNDSPITTGTPQGMNQISQHNQPMVQPMVNVGMVRGPIMGNQQFPSQQLQAPPGYHATAMAAARGWRTPNMMPPQIAAAAAAAAAQAQAAQQQQRPFMGPGGVGQPQMASASPQQQGMVSAMGAQNPQISTNQQQQAMVGGVVGGPNQQQTNVGGAQGSALIAQLTQPPSAMTNPTVGHFSQMGANSPMTAQQAQQQQQQQQQAAMRIGMMAVAAAQQQQGMPSNVNVSTSMAQQVAAAAAAQMAAGTIMAGGPGQQQQSVQGMQVPPGIGQQPPQGQGVGGMGIGGGPQVAGAPGQGPVMGPSNPQGQMGPNQLMGANQQAQPNPQMVAARQTIWSGALEWIEKPKIPTDTQKTTKQVPCTVSANAKDGEPELKADGWPAKLIMQLMPKQLIGNIGGAYLKNSKSVLFHPSPCEALESLTKVMSSGFAGCVHFTSNPPPPSLDIRVLILLYTAEKRAYLGFIPNDQAAFVDRLRKVIQQQKSTQMLRQNPMPNMHPQMGGPGPMGGPGGPMGPGQMGPGGVPTGMGMGGPGGTLMGPAGQMPPVSQMGGQMQQTPNSVAQSVNSQQGLLMSQTNTLAMGGGQMSAVTSVGGGLMSTGGPVGVVTGGPGRPTGTAGVPTQQQQGPPQQGPGAMGMQGPPGTAAQGLAVQGGSTVTAGGGMQQGMRMQGIPQPMNQMQGNPQAGPGGPQQQGQQQPPVSNPAMSVTGLMPSVQQQAQTQQQGPGQQQGGLGGVPNQQRPSIGPGGGPPVSASGQPPPFAQNQLAVERQANLDKITQLKQTLEAAQQQEQQYKDQLERISHMKTSQLQEALQIAQHQEMQYKMLDQQRMGNPGNAQGVNANQRGMMRPGMPNNPGLRTLLQQQPQYNRQQLMGMHQIGSNGPRQMGGPQGGMQSGGAPPGGAQQQVSFDDVPNFDFM